MPDIHHFKNQRFVIKIGGESGQGVNSIGEVFAKVFKRSGWHVFGYREYPSLIKGGYSCYQLDVQDQPLRSSSSHCDVLVCLSRVSLHKYLPTVRPNGIVLHSLPRFEVSTEEQTYLDQHHITLQYVPADKIAIDNGGKHIMANTVMTGIVSQLLGVDLELIRSQIREEFSKKPQLLDLNILCLEKGYEYDLEMLPRVSLEFGVTESVREQLLLTGNHAIALGAVAGGVRAYYAYPMTPSSSILSYLANIYHQTGMMVKQIEDEISVAQMAIGSMFMGTRALVATSGGGYDLMTESVSMAGITEIPFVCVLGQRPGPATGLPTWTADGDLNLAIYGGHGEYAKAVLAASDPQSCYDLVQRALNLAEVYQIPVIVLTDKEIAESLFAIDGFPAPLPIERNLVAQEELAHLTPHDRYADTPSGVSKRWLPGQAEVTYDSNSDEHLADGSLTEEAAPVKVMYDKRMRKMATILENFPEPVMYGDDDAELTFVGWGSVKNTVLDVIDILKASNPALRLGYLHYEYMYPLKTATFKKLTQSRTKLVLIENNYLGQLGALLTQETGYLFQYKLLKYDGRPFFIEDVLNFISQEVAQ
ncbi:MAG TPA: 2-oxoacid:acceptor oxidoreductase subunit alpha [Vitreimonas sp.]|nr:2-oxoacid:acceptor oxidoreductase subunit alpha [Vitreimonas sp.]